MPDLEKGPLNIVPNSQDTFRTGIIIAPPPQSVEASMRSLVALHRLNNNQAVIAFNYNREQLPAILDEAFKERRFSPMIYRTFDEVGKVFQDNRSKEGTKGEIKYVRIMGKLVQDLIAADPTGSRGEFVGAALTELHTHYPYLGKLLFEHLSVNASLHIGMPDLSFADEERLAAYIRITCQIYKHATASKRTYYGQRMYTRKPDFEESQQAKESYKREELNLKKDEETYTYLATSAYDRLCRIFEMCDERWADLDFYEIALHIPSKKHPNKINWHVLEVLKEMASGEIYSAAEILKASHTAGLIKYSDIAELFEDEDEG